MAANGRFRVCEHRSFSVLELRREHPFDAEDRRALCNLHDDAEAGLHGPVLSATEILGTAVYTMQHVIHRTPLFTVIAEARVKTHLRELNIRICPYLRTADEQVYELLVQLRRVQHGKRQGGTFVDVREACSVKSSCKACGAAFTSSCLEEGGHLLLNVRREVQELRDYKPRKCESVDVLANLEDCGQVCGKHKGTEKCWEGYHRLLEEGKQTLRRV